MKTKLILLLGLSILFYKVNAQIELENTYSNTDELTVVQLDSSTYKYVKYIETDTVLNISMYNIDHSIYKTIEINISSILPAEWFNLTNEYRSVDFGLNYFSKKLFDLDEDIEFLCEFYVSYQDSLWNNYYFSYSIIYGEDGSELLSNYSEGGNGDGSVTSRIYNSNEGMKMIVERRNENDCKVFSLPGYPNDIYNVKINNIDSKLVCYPNPSRNFVNIKYQLPKEINEATICIYNQNGRKIKEYRVDNTFDTLKISTFEFASGVYYFNIVSENKIIGKNKMIKI